MKVLKQRQVCDFELAIMNDEIYFREVLDLNIPIHYLIRRTKRDLSIFQMFYDVCKDFNPDIVHCWDSMTAMYSVPICKLLNIRLVNGMVVNSPERQNILNKHWRRAKLTFAYSDVIIGNSKAGLAAYRAPDNKSHVIYNGFNFKRADDLIDHNKIREELRITTRYIIGMVASYSNNKDYKTYFEAAQILLHKRKDVTFLAVGKDTDSTLSRHHIKHENADFFRLLGNKSSVESFIYLMDIGVLSTFTEGISNSILEYMAMGKPVIATNGGGTNEIIVDRETGFLTSRSNPKELAEKMEILLNNDELRVKMGCAGKERIQKCFAIDNMVNSYLDLYSEIHAKLQLKEVHSFKKFLRESIAFFLLQVYYVSRPKTKGIVSFYFHNPPPKLFDKILKWMVKKGYRFVSIQELQNIIGTKTDTKNLAFLCFDDGWRGNLDLVELIEKYKVPVVIFVPVVGLENGNYWWEYTFIQDQYKYSGIKKIEDFKKLPEDVFKEKVAILKQNYSLKERSCITADELKVISENEYITIGSHSLTHPILTSCSVETQRQELYESKTILSQLLNKEVDYLAYPNGNFDDNTIEIAKQCGYKLGFTTNPGRIDIEEVNPYMIPRNALYDNGGYYENISKILGIWQKFIPVKDH